MSSAVCVRIGVTLLAVVVGGRSEADTHVNSTVGYSIRPPRDFEVLAKGEAFGSSFSLSDTYLVDRFRCSKECYISLPEGGSTTFNREMWAMYFPTRSALEIAKAREERDKVKDGKATVSLSDEIYLSFEEWAKAKVSGFYFDGQKDGKVGSLPATFYEMKFEKLLFVPQRWFACAIRVPGGEFAVMFSLPESQFDKFKSECASACKSFKMEKETGLNAPGFDRSIELDLNDDDVDESKLSPTDLLARRKVQREEAFKKCLDTLPKGWRSFETDNYLIVYACDPKYAKLVSKQAEGVRKWLGETFPSVGDGFVQASIIKVYENADAMPDGYFFVFGAGKGQVGEISFGQPTSRGYTAEFSSLNLNVLSNWLSQKNPELWSRMPDWLEVGMREYIEDAELKGSKIVFGMDEWEKDRMNEARLAHSRYEGADAGAPFKPLRMLFTGSSDELFSGQNGNATRVQCASVVRYFIEGPGAKNAKTSRIIEQYIGHLYDLVEEVEKKVEESRKAGRSAESSKSKSEEERLKAEDEDYKKRRAEAYDKVAKDLLQQAFDRTFAGWDDRDWKALDASWKNYADGRTK